MKHIKELVERIDEELTDAKYYAEMYVEKKVRNESEYAANYKKMANDELDHATRLHTMAVNEIKEVEKVYQAPESMKESWRKSHAEYVEKTAWIKQMLSL